MILQTGTNDGLQSVPLSSMRADLLHGDGLHQFDLASECTAPLLATGVSAAVFGGEP